MQARKGRRDHSLNRNGRNIDEEKVDSTFKSYGEGTVDRTC